MRSLLAASPDFSNAREARFWRGLAAYHEGDFKESKNDLSQVLDTATQNDTLLLPTLQHLLLIATKEEDLETAEPLARTYIDAAQENADAPPLSPELLLWLASSCEKLGQHTQAVFWYEKLLPAAVDKNMKTLACAGLAKTRLALGRAEDALEAISLLQKNDPSMLEAPEILLLHAGALIANGKPKYALPLAEKVLSDSKDPLLSARARILIGDSYANLDQHQEALKYYTSASLLYDDPEVTPEALRKSAATAKKLGLHDEALNYERDLKQRYGMNSK
jgi:tetratricopeptide (TPR) repeat protein